MGGKQYYSIRGSTPEPGVPRSCYFQELTLMRMKGKPISLVTGILTLIRSRDGTHETSVAIR